MNFIASLGNLFIGNRWPFNFTKRSSRTSMDPTRDIYEIAWLLRQKLVPDIVATIMDQADFHLIQHSERREYRVVEQRNAPATCLLTEPITSNSRLLRPIRSVKFTIVSKDQGRADHPERGSWTWFTAGVFTSGDPRGIMNERCVVKNPVAQGSYTTHRIEWSASSDDPDISEWVKNLQMGDKIIVRGWAKYPGWMNFITSVEVDVSTAVITR